MNGAEFDQPPTTPRIRYLVCTTPFSGSTRLCRHLFQAGLGVPHEYYNPNQVKFLSERWGLTPQQIEKYPQCLRERRTTPNGLWGCALHWSHYELHRSLLDPQFASIQHYIYLVRRDTIAQAVSFQYSSPARASAASASLDPVERSFYLLEQQNQVWRAFFAQRGLQPLVLTYESFLENPSLTLSRIAEYLFGAAREIQKPEGPLPEEAFSPPMETTRSLLAQRLGERSHRLDPGDRKFLFLAGLHRSGTTPLFQILRDHPDISGFRDTGASKDEGQHLQSVIPSGKIYGGPGRFGFSPEAHLTETSPLASLQDARKLFTQWSRHWDLDRSYLLEKTPPSLIRTRFLQALFPQSHFIVLLRHPIAVSLATRKWAKGSSLEQLLEHWLHCHQIFEEDKKSLQYLLVVRYEDLIQEPTAKLKEVYQFLGLEARTSSLLDPGGNDGYFEEWGNIAQADPKLVERLLDRFESRLQPFGYSLRPG